jgi:2-phosphoglycerate kinase
MNPTTLNNVYWMGGSPCAGKSSMTHLLRNRFGLAVYHVDDALGGHLKRLDPTRHPTLIKWTSTAWDTLWMQPAEVLLREAIDCYTEHFALVLEDTRALSADPSVLVEGTALLPRQVTPLLAQPNQAIWVVPEAEFQRRFYAGRSWMHTILAECSAPDTAFQNWMERDIRFARWILGETAALGLKAIIVDGSTTIEQNAETVAAHFGLRAEPRP